MGLVHISRRQSDNGVDCQSLGIYFILFLVALFLFRRKKGRQNRAHQIMSAAMLWMFLVATAHFVCAPPKDA
jgi:hypothetical protein